MNNLRSLSWLKSLSLVKSLSWLKSLSVVKSLSFIKSLSPVKSIALISLWLLGFALLSQGLYMDGKAVVAQGLISKAWHSGNTNRPPSKPWPWADTRPIAKLEAVRLKKTTYVMQDASGESLAFGPGHLPNSAKPANSGHVMIAGHRDSHFSFLKDLQIGDLLNTDNYKAEKRRYRISEIKVINTDTELLNLTDQNLLTLITCYPFDTVIPGGPLRMIINATAIDSIPISDQQATQL